jgi:hypothetical protein
MVTGDNIQHWDRMLAVRTTFFVLILILPALLCLAAWVRGIHPTIGVFVSLVTRIGLVAAALVI